MSLARQTHRVVMPEKKHTRRLLVVWAFCPLPPPTHTPRYCSHIHPPSHHDILAEKKVSCTSLYSYSMSQRRFWINIYHRK